MDKAIYRASVSMTICFDILANSEEEALDYISTHKLPYIIKRLKGDYGEYGDSGIIEMVDTEDISKCNYNINIT